MESHFSAAHENAVRFLDHLQELYQQHSMCFDTDCFVSIEPAHLGLEWVCTTVDERASGDGGGNEWTLRVVGGSVRDRDALQDFFDSRHGQSFIVMSNAEKAAAVHELTSFFQTLASETTLVVSSPWDH